MQFPALLTFIKTGTFIKSGSPK